VKKLLKLLVAGVLVVSVLAGGAALYINETGIPHCTVEKVDLQIALTPERLVRGRKIASVLCASCHLDPTTGKLTGHRMADSPPQFGVAFLHLTGCCACHSADFSTNDDLDPEQSKGFFGGGNTMTDFNGRSIKTANLTPDRETGIGNWTEDQFIRAVKGGFRPDKSPIVYPMQAYIELTDDEVGAIYAYLKTIAPISNRVARTSVLTASGSATQGKKIYYEYSCQSCHGESGLGLCDLRQNRKHYPADDALGTFIRNPSAAHPGSKMPAWEGAIEPSEYAPLVQYLRELADHDPDDKQSRKASLDV